MLKSLVGGKGKGKGKGRRNIGMLRRTGKTNPERVIWIGGLDGKEIDKEGNKKLKELLEKKSGASVKYVEINAKGHGGAICGSEDDAQSVIGSLNGTKFMGKKLEIDVWQKGLKFEEEE